MCPTASGHAAMDIPYGMLWGIHTLTSSVSVTDSIIRFSRVYLGMRTIFTNFPVGMHYDYARTSYPDLDLHEYGRRVLLQ